MGCIYALPNNAHVVARCLSHSKGAGCHCKGASMSHEFIKQGRVMLPEDELVCCRFHVLLNILQTVVTLIAELRSFS